MKLSKNFTLEELSASATARRRGIDNTPTVPVIENLERLCKDVLQPVRDRFGHPMIITSGYRCPELNKAVGGVATSQHLRGEAADIKCYNNKALFRVIERMVRDGEIVVGQLIDEYDFSWVHVSLPTAKLRNQIKKIK